LPRIASVVIGAALGPERTPRTSMLFAVPPSMRGASVVEAGHVAEGPRQRNALAPPHASRETMESEER
jgi:hypothetical protein